MSYIHPKAEQLVGKIVHGTAECFVLIRAHTKAPDPSRWQQGAAVRGHCTLPIGTAIATFANGRLLTTSQGGHAAFYVGQDARGLFVVDQWEAEDKFTIGRRHLRFAEFLRAREKHAVHDIGDNYSVIE